jgi:hypothetical protein
MAPLTVAAAVAAPVGMGAAMAAAAPALAAALRANLAHRHSAFHHVAAVLIGPAVTFGVARSGRVTCQHEQNDQKRAHQIM